MAPMPEPNCRLPSSPRPRKSLGAAPAGGGWLASARGALDDRGGETVNDFAGGNFQQLGRLAHALVLLGEIGPRRVAGQRLDAAHAGSDRALAHDPEDGDIARAPDMGAAAQLDGISVAGPPALGIPAHAV